MPYTVALNRDDCSAPTYFHSFVRCHVILVFFLDSVVFLSHFTSLPHLSVISHSFSLVFFFSPYMFSLFIVSLSV